jgi:hypothetical protein
VYEDTLSLLSCRGAFRRALLKLLRGKASAHPFSNQDLKKRNLLFSSIFSWHRIYVNIGASSPHNPVYNPGSI